MPALSRKEKLKQESGSYVPKLVACFYAVFDPTLGPRVVHQIPEGSVATALSTFPSRVDSPSDPSPSSSQDGPQPNAAPVGSTAESSIIRSTPVLFDFSSVIDFVIPKPELCGHLITKATRTSKILGLPTRIVDEEKYHHSKQVYNRNSFIFNLCFVFERDAELSVYEPVAWKVGRIIGQLEETHSLLSSPPAEFSMANLLEQMYLDLNAYSETSISLLDTDLSLFLLPFYANPPDVRVWDVPIAVADLESMKSYSWDVTLYKICSFINGVNHVRKIAELAEVDLYLARMCIRHLVYYNAVILVDLFQFTNSYTVLPDVAEIAHAPEDDDDEGTDVRVECENYVFSGTPDADPVPFSTLLKFYSQLRPGLTVSSWIDDLSLDDHPIDVRRMIQFGVIKGFIRRVYAYPVWLEHPLLARPLRSNAAGGADTDERTKPAAGTSSSTRKTLTTHTLKRLELDSLDATATRGVGGGGGMRGQADDLRPLISRANSSQPKMLHSPHSETSTRSAPPEVSRNVNNPNNNKVPLPGAATTSSSRNSPAVVAGSDDIGFESSRVHRDDVPAVPDSSAGAGAGGASGATAPVYPTSLALMLDGTHHTDEICLKYGIGSTTLSIVLKHLGGGGGGGGASGTSNNAAGGGGGGARTGRGTRHGDDEDIGQSRGGGAARRSSRDAATGANGYDKSGYGQNVVMLWI